MIKKNYALMLKLFGLFMFFWGVISSGGCSQDMLNYRAARDSYGVIGCPQEAIKITNGENYPGAMNYYKWVAICNGRKFYCRVPDMTGMSSDSYSPVAICAKGM